jgi:putative restriction endonuclease
MNQSHILPVGAPQSNDQINNGLALSPTYHRAFDYGLIYLDNDHVMRLNASKMTELTAIRLIGGIEGFKAPLGKILLPQDRAQWPNPEFIRRANRFRLI